MERAARLLGKVKFPKGTASPEDRARAAWPMAVGRLIAARTRVYGLVRNTLVVEVEDMVWQKQLFTLRWQILDNMRAALGPDLVLEVEFRPMIPRLGPRTETVPRPAAPDSTLPSDPVLAVVYRNSRKKASA